MTIFGDTTITINNITYTHNQTTWDTATNYIFGALLLLLIPLGVVFNMLLYIKNHIHSGTPSSVIYRCLAVSDFLVCTFRGVQQTVALFSPTQQRFYDNTTPSVITKVIALITMLSGICMMVVITLLSVLRLLSLVFPFWVRANTTQVKYFVISYIFVTVGVSTGIAAEYLFREHVYFASVTQWVVPFQGETAQYVIDVIIPIVCMSLTSLSSVLTIAYLVKTGTSARRKSSITILLMSTGLILWNLMLFVALSPKCLPIDHDSMPVFVNNKYEVYYVYYLITCFFPLVLAVYNSFVVVIRSSEIREFVQITWCWFVSRFHGNWSVQTDGGDTDTTRLVQPSSSS